MIIRQEIKNALSQQEIESWECLAIRVVDAQHSVGDELPASRRWDDGEVTDEMLQGTSAIDVNRIGLDATVSMIDDMYIGGDILVIRGDDMGWGEDTGEIIVGDATVVAVIAR